LKCVDGLVEMAEKPAPRSLTAPTGASAKRHRRWTNGPQIAALTMARASSEDALSSLAIHRRAQRTELTIATAGAWKPATDSEVYRINESRQLSGAGDPRKREEASPFRATSFVSCAQCRIAARFSLKCMLEKVRRMKVRFNWWAWIPPDVRSRQRATGPSPD
jgi:hypothetical protein